jgi:hypothetical protein
VPLRGLECGSSLPLFRGSLLSASLEAEIGGLSALKRQNKIAQGTALREARSGALGSKTKNKLKPVEGDTSRP